MPNARPARHSSEARPARAGELIKTAYDDGGFSGGTMERPALQQLLADIRAGLVDVVVVYKVDRLTRSLADFAKMVELFDAQGVSFVAVTQQFNTTTSMGRLTLNVLLSFAQFEREVIGERIRDKIAASKRKGMWMGGSCPLGYDVRERKLVVNQDEAQDREADLRALPGTRQRPAPEERLDQRGIVSGVKVSKKRQARAGSHSRAERCTTCSPTRSTSGEIRHKNERHPGQHEAIVSRELWERVQQRLRNQAVRRGEGRKTEAPRSPLAGKLFDEERRATVCAGSGQGPAPLSLLRLAEIGQRRTGRCRARVANIRARRSSEQSRLLLKPCSPTALRSRSRSKSLASIRIGCLGPEVRSSVE